jgi:hypothetical protein
MKRISVLVIIAVALLPFPSLAHAGEYQVKACLSVPGVGMAYTNTSWVPEPDPGGVVAAYTANCWTDGIVTRMTGDPNRTAPWGVGARNVFRAPPTTLITGFRADVLVTQSHGWAAGLVDATPRWALCGLLPCWPPPGWNTLSFAMNTPALFAQVTCGSTTGCSRAAQYGMIEMKNVIVTIRDDTPPSVRITGGSATSNWWQRDVTVSYAANDPTGIRNVYFYIDGSWSATDNGGCWDGYLRPCGDVGGSRTVVPDSRLGDGLHVLTVAADDGGYNRSSASHTVLIDRTPPPAPLNAQLAGDRWRARNTFDVAWENPVQNAAPMAVAHARFCPRAAKSTDTTRCGDEQTRQLHNGTGFTALRVPSQGDWQLRLWLEDAAGNTDPQSAAVVSGFGLDESPPELAIAKPDDEDPARVRVVASDAVSGIAAGQVEAKRRGENAWRALPTVLDARGFSAVMNDETLPAGIYEVRARAVDKAGNERSTMQQVGGGEALRKLPLRIRTRLVVGRPTRVRARDSHGRTRYRTVLVVKPRANFGNTIPLSGRLTTPGGNPLAGAVVEVSQRVKLRSAPWKRIAMVRTSRTGRFRFRALRGPSRRLRFRYPGTAKIRARSTDVDLGVRARTSIRANRGHVVNGEDVTFQGRLRGREYGSVGKTIYLQVYTRGRWATFATPRAAPTSGRWSQDYRFTATRGLVRYRFRAVVPREAGYPYERGTSRVVRVTVRGL